MTTRERWAEIERHLDELIGSDPPARAAALARLEAEDPELCAAVSALLDADDRATGVLDEPVSALADVGGSDDDEELAEPSRAGTVVDAYRIADQIGSGGMGEVYLAERADGQFEQTVALKMIRRGMGSRDNRRRFVQERQILARLVHPAITRLLDGGVTEHGQPYLVMELVEGRPLTLYAEEHGLDVPARLALFDKVTDAVGYAHRHLVVHRDLKPSNVMVTDSGDVKLLDFGIAKLVEEDDAEGLTRVGTFVLTPEYAAPEQVRDEPITTATDVYALGVLLYELLSGTRPHRLTGTSRAELESAIVQAEPEPLPPHVDRDLAMIVSHALAKEPERRYPTADALRDDLVRYRDGLPITARAPSFRYRAGKFVRRNRVAVGAAAIVFVAILAGMAGTIWQAQAARREAARATLVKDLLVDVFRGADPDVAAGETMTATDVLQRGIERIDAQLEGDPVVRSEMLHTVGVLLTDLGDHRAAYDVLLRSLTLRQRHGFPDGHGEWESLDALATAALHLERYDEADSLFRTAIEALPDGDEDVRRPRALNNLAVLLARTGDYDAAESLHRESIALDQARYGPVNAEVATDYSNLATLLYETGREAESDSLHQVVLDMRRSIFAGDHTSLAASLHNLAELKRALGDMEAAESIIDETIAMKRRLYEGDHPSLASSLNVRGKILYAAGRRDDAEEQLREVIDMNERLGLGHSEQVANAYNDLGIIAYLRGDLALARDRFEPAMDLFEEILGPDHATVATIMGNVATLERLLGRLDSAERRYREVLDLHLARYGEDHPQIVIDLNNLGVTLRARGDPIAATELHRRALEVARRVRGGDAFSDVASSRASLASALMETGDLVEAEALFRGAIAFYEAELPEGDNRTVGAWTGLGRVLTLAGRATEAHDVLERALSVCREHEGERSTRTARVMVGLGRCLSALGRDRDAIEMLTDARNILGAELGDAHYDVREADVALSDARDRAGRIATPTD